MTPDERERMYALCEQLAKEKDHKKSRTGEGTQLSIGAQGEATGARHPACETRQRIKPKAEMLSLLREERNES